MLSSCLFCILALIFLDYTRTLNMYLYVQAATVLATTGAAFALAALALALTRSNYGRSPLGKAEALVLVYLHSFSALMMMVR